MSPTGLITGASSGLGRGLAVRMARDGWSVGLAARREEVLREVAGEVEEAGGRAAILPCDVSDREAVRGAVAACRDQLGPIDLLIANAGVAGQTDARSLDAAHVERLMGINFMGSVYAAEAVLPEMLERGSGQLVAMSSLAGFGGLPLTAAYSASKGAMTNFFESLRVELAGSGVDVTVLTPGYVRTPMTDQADHYRPFLVELDDGVERMWKAIRGRKKALAFPRPLSTLVFWAQIFPRSLYDWIAGSVDRG